MKNLEYGMDFSEKQQEKKPSLLERLEQYAASDMVPMHMPGHKRNAIAPYLDRLCAACDITEIDGFDDLHDAKGILASAMQRASSLWKSGRTWFLCGGSTCGILAGMRAALGSGGRAVVFRNCHKSVYHALELIGCPVTYVKPQIAYAGELCGSASPALLRLALERHPDTALVVLTSPTYEGVISDVEEICRIAHDFGAAVLVDEAHGAHLGFSAGFPKSAVQCGADLVVQSIHKTLPGLTQTALLHRNGGRISDDELERQLGIFETSSPSYLLMASIDGCVRLIGEQGNRLFSDWEMRLAAFDERTGSLCRLRLPGHGAERDRQEDGIYAMDPSKIVILTSEAGISGTELSSMLRNRFHIELEMAAARHAVAMTGLGDSDTNLERLADALLAIDGMLSEKDAPMPIGAPAVWQRELLVPEYGIAEAVCGETELVPVSQAIGRISAGYLWAYPPGVPILIPGERIGGELPALLREYRMCGVELKHQPTCAEGMLWCLSDRRVHASGTGQHRAP